MDTLQSLSPQQFGHFLDVAWLWTEEFVPRVVATVIIVVLGFFVASWLDRLVRRLLGNVRMDPTLRPILGAVVRYSVTVLAIVVGLSQLGIQTASLLAVVGAAGLAIGLALQGTLSNIAAGMMLLWLRPFHVGDYIEVGGQSGAVEEIGLFVCQLRTFDGLFLFMPNSSIWNQPLKNHTRNGGRLISVSVSVPATADLDRVRQTLIDVASKMPNALPGRSPEVFVDKLDGGKVILTLTIWSTPQGAGDIERRIIEQARQAVDALGETTAPSQIVRTVPPDGDPSRFLESRRPWFV
jgi:small conductance mechanosensitive channel